MCESEYREGFLNMQHVKKAEKKNMPNVIKTTLTIILQVEGHCGLIRFFF